MNLAIGFSTVNWLAVIVATVSAFLLAGAWYSPLLFGRFLRGSFFDDELTTNKARNIGWIFVSVFVLLWAAAAFLAGLLGPDASTREGRDVGFGVGLLFAFPAFGIATLFEGRPARCMLISGPFFILCYGVMGTIIAAWP